MLSKVYEIIKIDSLLSERESYVKFYLSYYYNYPD